jgi:CheY-like chemotaxis protein
MNDNFKNHVEILLVEDNEDDAALIIRSLKKHNLTNQLVHVNDGAKALDFIFARGSYAGREINDVPKVVLLDLKMPKVDGLQVLKEIRSDERTRLIPIIIMTSSKEEKDIIASYKLGVNSYIVKPVEFENFAKAVAEVGLYWLMLNQPPKL